MNQSNRPRVDRLAAGTILNASASTKKALKGVVDETIDQAAAEFARRKSDERRHKAELLGAVLLLSKTMATKAAAAIYDGRQRARRESVRRVIAELAAIGIVLSGNTFAGSFALGALMSSHHTRADEDHAHAQSAADSLAAAWQGMAVYGVGLAMRERAEPASAIRVASRPMVARIDRTARTETVQAYSDAHKYALPDAMRFDEGLASQILDLRVVRHWSAFLEACPACAAHDGDEVYVGEDFDGGDEPGFMHPHCFCYETLMLPAEEMRLAS